MTREEAIDYNKNLKMYMKLSDKQNPCKFLEENYIALDMAIEALKAETKKCPICGSDLYEYCFMCCYEGEVVKNNDT